MRMWMHCGDALREFTHSPPLWIHHSCRGGGAPLIPPLDLFIFLYMHVRNKQTVSRGISETLSLAKYQLAVSVAATATQLEADLRFAFLKRSSCCR